MSQENSNAAIAQNGLLSAITPKQMFIDELNRFVTQLNIIDKATPWQEVEPEWWLELSSIRQNAINVIQKFGA